MKTTIYISGQISGNFTLRNAIITAGCEEKKGMNSIELIFPTKKAARKALWEGFKYIRRNTDTHLGVGGVSYSKHGILNYDASRAEIQENR